MTPTLFEFEIAGGHIPAPTSASNRAPLVLGAGWSNETRLHPIKCSRAGPRAAPNLAVATLAPESLWISISQPVNSQPAEPLAPTFIFDERFMTNGDEKFHTARLVVCGLTFTSTFAPRDRVKSSAQSGQFHNDSNAQIGRSLRRQLHQIACQINGGMAIFVKWPPEPRSIPDS